MMNNFNLEINTRTDEEFFNALKENTSKLGQLFNDEISITSTIQHNNNNNNNNKDGNKPSAYSFDFQRENVNVLPQLPIDNDNYWHWNTLIAKVVIAFCNNQAMGKTGLALLMNRDKQCMLVAYRSKANVLSSILLHRNGNGLYKQNKYWQFYDENADCWSLYFCSENDEKEFADVLTSVGYHLSMPLSGIMQNDDEVPTAIQISKNTQTKTPKVFFTYLNSLNNATDNAASANSNPSVIGRAIKFGQKLPQTVQAATRAQLVNCSTEAEESPNTLLAAQSESVIVSVGNKNSIFEKLNDSPQAINSKNLELQNMQMFMSEQRSLGTELRFNVNRIEQKVEMLLDHLSLMQKILPQPEAGQREDEILLLEEKLLHLKKENRHLKQLNEDKSMQNHDLDVYIEMILSEYEEQLQRLNIDKNYDLKIILNALIETLNQLQDEVNDKSSTIKDLISDNQKVSSELDGVKRDLHKHENLVKTLQENESELKRQLDDSKLLNEALKKEFDEEKKQLSNKLTKETETICNTVKCIMNDLYLEIATKLHAQSDLNNSNHILSIIGRTIREQTLKTLPAI